MATFLQLCQQVHRLVRSDNAEPGTQPVSVVSQTKTLGDIVYCVQKAWLKIQMHHPDWRWMRSSVAVDLTPNVDIVTVANFRVQQARFASIVPFVAQAAERYVNIRDKGAVGAADNRCYFIPFQEYTGWWNRSPAPGAAMPFFFTEQPNRSIRVYPKPSTPPSTTNWLLTTGCRLTPQELLVDADEPEMPAEFHELIVWVATHLFTVSRSNMSQLSGEARQFSVEWMFKLASDQLPEMTECARYV